jgi:predicted amidohydrolase
MQDLKVALIQTQQFWEDKSANLRHYESNFLEQLIGQELDLVLLPEMFNTGFTMNAQKMAETADGDTVKWLIKWAKTLKCQIGGSLIIGDDNTFYNRFIVVSEDGILSHYDKRHLFRMADEHEHYTAGERRVVHEIKGWKILLQVCYDLRFPVFSRNKTINDAKEYDAVIYIANWPSKRNFVWKTLLQARAMENQAYCIGVNRVGKDGNGFEYTGDSMLVDPWGQKIFEFSENEERVKILTMEYQTILDITERFPAFKDADKEL